MPNEQREILSVEEIKKILNFIHKGYNVPKIIYDTIFEIAKREIEEKDLIVLAKRDPNIGKGRIQAFFPRIVEGEALEIYPPVVVGFGADFDGDSIWGKITLKIINKINNIEELFETQIYNLKKTEFFEYYKTLRNVDFYKVNENFEIKIKAIDPKNGDICFKKITEFTIHNNLRMYKIKDSKDRFETFWASQDHSLIVYNNDDDKIEKISPNKIKENPNKYFLIKQKN